MEHEPPQLSIGWRPFARARDANLFHARVVFANIVHVLLPLQVLDRVSFAPHDPVLLTDRLRTRRPGRRFHLRHQRVAKAARARVPAGWISRTPGGFAVHTRRIRVREDTFRHIRLGCVAFSSCFFFFDDAPFFLLCDALLLCLSLSSANGTSMTCALVCECDLWPKPDEDFFFPKAAKMLSPSVLTELKPWLKLTRIKEDKMANMTNPLVAMRDWWRNEFTKPRVDFFLFPSVMSFAAW